jgi:tetratricopeptide (TPR) repeat protein
LRQGDDTQALSTALAVLRRWPAVRASRTGQPPCGIPVLQPTLARIGGCLAEPKEPGTVHTLIGDCLRVARWAEAQGAMLTAGRYSEVAARLAPENAHTAYEVGRIARRLGLPEVAASWLTQAAALARATREWRHQALALTLLAEIAWETGDVRRAAKLLRTARRGARRSGIRLLEGDALYALARLHLAERAVEPAAEAITEAVVTYGAGHQRIHALAEDVAWAWLGAGEHQAAVELYQLLHPHVEDPSRATHALACLARAASATADEHLYEWSTVAALTSLDGSTTAAASLVQLALAAGNLAYWPRAETLASMALDLAGPDTPRALRVQARTILEAVRMDVIPTGVMESVFPDTPHLDRSPWQRGPTVTAVLECLADALRERRDGFPAAASAGRVR